MSTETYTDKVPPQSLEAEMALLGAMIIDPEVIPEVRLNATEFYRSAHRAIFQAIIALDSAGTGVDLVTLVEHMKQTNDLDLVGGSSYIASLATGAATSVNHKYHADIIREKAMRRTIMARCYEVIGSVHDAPLETLQDKLYIDLDHGEIQHKHIRDVVVKVSEQADRRYKARREGRADSISGVPSGFLDLDTALDGFQPGELVIIGGDTGMGKSALMGQIARHAGQFVPVHINNLEMTAERNVARMVADAGDIESWRIRKAWMDQAQWGHFTTTLGELGRLDVTFDDKSMTLGDIRQSMVRAIKAGARLLVLDYLQLVSNRNARNPEEEVGSIAKELKQIAKNYRVPVICLTSLNRELEKRPNKRPIKSDLRGSGSIEYAADVIIFVYRESKYTERFGQTAGIKAAELIIAKGRDIGESTIKQGWDGERARFTDPPEKEG